MKDTKLIDILWLSPFSPISTSVEGGGQTFNYYFKCFQHDNRFNIRFISSGLAKQKDTIESENKDVIHVVAYPAENIKEIIKKIPDLESRHNPLNRHANLLPNYYVRLALKTMRQWKRGGYNPDFVIFEWTSTLMFAPKVREIFPKANFVASEHDVMFMGYKRKKDYYTGIEKLKWSFRYKKEKELELKGLKLCDLILPHNNENSIYLQQEGIEKDKIQWLVPYYNDMSLCKRKSNHRDILFFGAMGRPENSLSAIWFVNNVMPLLHDLDIRFVILGSNPPENLKSLESDRVHITGFVKSVELYFEESMCLASPLVLGAGIKIKILEALSSGIPVLTNEIGIEGIPAKAGTEYYHCIEPQEYEQVIRKLYNRDINEDELCTNAKSFIVNNFSVEKSFGQYKKKLIELVENK